LTNFGQSHLHEEVSARSHNTVPGCVGLTLASGLGLWADAPPDYYDRAAGQSGQALRSALHQIINDHRVVPYSGGATDVTAALKVLDQDPNNSNNVILVYSGRSDPGTKFNTADGWNREHLWCNSYGAPHSDVRCPLPQ